MNDLLFTVLIIALLYYFFYYLPAKKQLDTKFNTQTISTQTDPFTTQDEKQLESTLDELIKEIRKLNQTIQ